jgi:mono/diheme cytochrome c family protein
MRFYIIAAIVLLPLLGVLSLLQPFFTGVVEKPIGPEFVVPSSGSGDLVRGEALYHARCYGCHAPQAKVGAALDTADFKERYADDQTLAIAVRTGRQPMPAYTTQMLSDQELSDIIAYIRSLPLAPTPAP